MRGGGSRDTPTPVSTFVAPSSPVREKGGQSYSHSIPLSQFHTTMHIPSTWNPKHLKKHEFLRMDEQISNSYRQLTENLSNPHKQHGGVFTGIHQTFQPFNSQKKVLL